MWQNQDHSIELLPHSFTVKAWESSCYCSAVCTASLVLSDGVCRDSFWKPMWSIRFFELLFCFHPRQRCLALWAETIDCFNLLLKLSIVEASSLWDLTNTPSFLQDFPGAGVVGWRCVTSLHLCFSSWDGADVVEHQNCSCSSVHGSITGLEGPC